jgi:flagellar P-ring protein precursor FlgI
MELRLRLLLLRRSALLLRTIAVLVLALSGTLTLSNVQAQVATRAGGPSSRDASGAAPSGARLALSTEANIENAPGIMALNAPSLSAPAAHAAAPAPVVRGPLARIKDIASIEGIRDNQLVGYGLVVGLQGTGDSQQTVFPAQTLSAMLLRMGISVPAGAIRVQNLAAVFVSASLPPFAEPGTKLDITVSSAGDARSLEGGVLLMTPLYGTDGQIYAQAQGALVVGGYAVNVNGNIQQVNHPTTARIPYGASVERGVPLNLAGRDHVSVLLNDADFKSAEAMASAINSEFGQPLARAADSRRIDLSLRPGQDVPELLSRVEAIEVPIYPRAKVIVNERTGTVVIGGRVVLQPVSILHGGLAVNVVTDFNVSQPAPFSGGTTQVTPVTTISTRDKPVSRIELKQGATVDDLVRSLQTIGASARDVISILQAMKAAGALEAEIEVQ